MPYATLVINQPGQPARTYELAGGGISIGREPDNSISLEGDSNVSRYHAVIKSHDGHFFLSDLNSSNGTTLNDAPIEAGSEHPLQDGDRIGLGGTSTIEFHLSAGAGQGYGASGVAAPPPTPAGVASQSATAAPQSGGVSPLIMFGAIGGGLALVAVVAVVLVYNFSGGCDASVRIISPQSGTTIRGPIPIRVESEGTKCIDRVIFQLDGEKIASSEVPPYEIVLDPAKLPDVRGGNHVLSATVEDEDGNKTLQPETVLLAFPTRDEGTGKEETAGGPPERNTNGGGQTERGGGSSVSLFDLKDMSAKLSRQINSKGDYIYDNEFLRQVQARTSDYQSAGYFDRARAFRDVINESFVGEQGIEAPLGYVMAMSRTRFNLAKSRPTTTGLVTSIAAGDEPQGLWLIQPSLAQSTGYIGRCGTQTLADPDQKCSAIVASMYLKFLEVDIFSGDFLYAVACFSLPPKEAAAFRDGLPSDRRDFWKVLKSQEQRERVVRFFAAGIVGENPEKFDLRRDKALSNLYPKK